MFGDEFGTGGRDDASAAPSFMMDHNEYARRLTRAEADTPAARSAAVGKHLEAVARYVLLKPAETVETNALAWVHKSDVRERVVSDAVTAVLECGLVPFSARMTPGNAAVASRRVLGAMAAGIEAAVALHAPDAAAANRNLGGTLLRIAKVDDAADHLREARQALAERGRRSQPATSQVNTAPPRGAVLTRAAQTLVTGEAAVLHIAQTQVLPMLSPLLNGADEDAPSRVVEEAGVLLQDVAEAVAISRSLGRDDVYRRLVVAQGRPAGELAVAVCVAVITAARAAAPATVDLVTAINDPEAIAVVAWDALYFVVAEASSTLATLAALRDVRRWGPRLLCDEPRHPCPMTEKSCFTPDRAIDPFWPRPWSAPATTNDAAAPAGMSRAATTFSEGGDASAAAHRCAEVLAGAKVMVREPSASVRVVVKGSSPVVVVECRKCLMAPAVGGSPPISLALATHVRSGTVLALLAAISAPTGDAPIHCRTLAKVSALVSPRDLPPTPLRTAPVSGVCGCGANERVANIAPLVRRPWCGLLCAVAAGWGDARVLHEAYPLTSSNGSRLVGALLRPPFAPMKRGRPRRHHRSVDGEDLPDRELATVETAGSASVTSHPIEIDMANEPALSDEEQHLLLLAGAKQEAIKALVVPEHA